MTVAVPLKGFHHVDTESMGHRQRCVDHHGADRSTRRRRRNGRQRFARNTGSDRGDGSDRGCRCEQPADRRPVVHGVRDVDETRRGSERFRSCHRCRRWRRVRSTWGCVDDSNRGRWRCGWWDGRKHFCGGRYHGDSYRHRSCPRCRGRCACRRQLEWKLRNRPDCFIIRVVHGSRNTRRQHRGRVIRECQWWGCWQCIHARHSGGGRAGYWGWVDPIIREYQTGADRWRRWLGHGCG
jgi:hypothetical protein